MVSNMKFNISSGSPATDVCCFCVRTHTQIYNSVNITGKGKHKTELKSNRFKKAQFYKLIEMVW